MKQRKNAFTLIELLAVIIILAAIALIIAPLVLDIIKEQQMKTFKESINGILRSSRLEIVNSGLKFPVTFTYSDGKLISPTGKELKVTGKIPEGTGSVRYNSEDNIDLAITDNTWCGTYNKTSKEVEVNAFNGTCGITLVNTPEKCFTFDSSTGTITKYNKSDNDCGVNVVIPDTIGGVTVKVIGEYAFLENINGENSKRIMSVSLPSGLERIDGYAFMGEGDCTLEAYYNEKSEIQILKNNKDIYAIPLSNSPQLVISNSCIRNTIQHVDFSRATKLTTIGYGAFAGNQLTNVDLSNLTSLTTIGPGAFAENQLTTVDLSNLINLTTIGYGAFAGNQLTNVDLSNLTSLTTIGEGAFAENQLTTVDLSNLTNLVTIESYAFGYNQLTNVTFGSINKLETIGCVAFGNSNFTFPSYDRIPSSVTTNYGFDAGCTT